MTLADCRSMARMLMSAKTIYPPTRIDSFFAEGDFYSYTIDSATTKEVMDYNFPQGGGFCSRYSRPGSRGGLYVSAEDLNIIFKYGIGYGKNKVYGWTNAGQTGYFPPGALVRSDNGNLMVRTTTSNRGNETTPPHDGKPDSLWKDVCGEPSFPEAWAGYTNPYMGGDAFKPNNDVVPSLDIDFRTTKTTETYLAASFKPTMDAMVSFLYSIRVTGEVMGYTSRYPRWKVVRGHAFPIVQIEDEDASFSLRLSKYDDVLSNEEHQDEWIELLHCHGKYKSPEVWIPLKASAKYYLYLHYDKCFTPLKDGGGWNFGSSAIVTYYSRENTISTVTALVRLKWPTF